MVFNHGLVWVLAACLSAVQGLRQRRKAAFAADSARVKTHIAGVPVRNYQEGGRDWIILFGPKTTDEDILRACNGRCGLVGHPDKGGVPFAQVRGLGEMEALVTEGSGGIQLVEPDGEDHMIPELDEVSTEDQASWGLDMIGVAERPASGKGVHIYVQDTGVRVSHRDFGGRASALMDFTTGELVLCNGDSACVSDSIGHGTHVAGTTGGDMYGVANQANIYAIKTLGDSGSGQQSWNIGSIDWIATTGRKPAVINLSLGGKGQNQGYEVAINAASAVGVTVVVAAGNFGTDACTYSPAFVPSAITVGALGGEEARASYSNFGTCVDIMAPGTSITSASQIADTMSARLTGTSMSCPHVAGGAAVLLSMYPWYNRDAIFAHFESHGRKGYMRNLKPGDPDLLLWVGRNKAPGKPACPDGNGPNYWGDCECPSGQFCYTGGSSRNCPTSYGEGGWGGNHFVWDCAQCQCK